MQIFFRSFVLPALCMAIGVMLGGMARPEIEGTKFSPITVDVDPFMDGIQKAPLDPTVRQAIYDGRAGEFLVSVSAQESVTLTTPEAIPSLTGFTVERMIVQRDDPATASVDEGELQIVLKAIGRPGALHCLYNSATTPTGSFLVNALNKANLSSAYNNNATTGSLMQRIFHRLVIMNEAPAVCGRAIAGSLSGNVP